MTKKKEAPKSESNKNEFEFDVEVGKVLSLMINSLYTNKDIALRELIANASDACDKLRYEAAQKADILQKDEELKISIEINKEKQQISLTDNGIGMSKKELIDNLGTIARSGTEKFVQSLAKNKDEKSAIDLIGQFGVGFYSSFMVADQVEVISRKFSEKSCNKWTSKGSSKFTIDKVSKEEEIERGTKIILHLKDDATDFLDRFHVKHVVQTYCDHINVKIELIPDNVEAGASIETLNSASALWKMPKNEITEEQYNNFYKQMSHLPGEPFMTLHNAAEGLVSYTNLLFIPSSKPFDLFHPDRKSSVKLYVKKVFISEDLNLVPAWMRFLRGLIDSDDLPLNISRETLQHNIVLEKIKKAVVNKVLSELKKKSNKDEEKFLKFWNNFGAVLKEGLCESSEFREKTLEICRFATSKSNGKLITLSEYLDRIKKNQDKIYYLTGENIEKIESSPQLEAFKAKDVEVLYLTDAVDDFWVTVSLPYKEKEFQSINRSDIDLENIDKEKKEGETEEEKSANDDKEKKEKDVTNSQFDDLIAKFKELLGEKVKDVRISKKLTNSPVCLAVDAMAMDIRMERYMLEQKQIKSATAKILEINPNNPIVKNLQKSLKEDGDKEEFKDKIFTLYDMACITEDEPVANSKEFCKRIEKLLS